MNQIAKLISKLQQRDRSETKHLFAARLSFFDRGGAAAALFGLTIAEKAAAFLSHQAEFEFFFSSSTHHPTAGV